MKKFLSYVLNDEKPLHDRQLILMLTVTILAWIITLVEKTILGRNRFSNIALAAGIVIYILVTVVCVKMNKIRFGAVILTAGVCFGYIPATFFYSGGIYGDAPLWFLFSILFVCMALSGKAKIILLILDGVCAAVCWFISFHYPYIYPHNNSRIAHIYSLVAFFLIAVAVSIMMGFQNYLYKRENARSEKQKKEIEALNKSQNQFFSSMSHEIRTPINTIIGLNEMILREDISDEVADDAANIQSASRLLLHLINDILDMSKFASGQMELTPVIYHPGDMLSEIVGMLWLRAKEKGLEFHVNVAPNVPAELLGDEVRIKQILINVLNNAIKYTKEGSVSLSIQCGDRSDDELTVIYSVSDTGIGIKKENIPYLFTAFKRVDEENNRRIEGTGLGLSIVKQFVDLMEGRITVNSVYTKGSTFVIEIPQKIVGDQSIGEVDLETRTAATRRKEHRTRFTAAKARILVVDDNVSNLMVVSKLLRETKVQVETVSSGAEALKRTLDNFYHVIFMDHLMPEMNGIECLKAIRTQVGGHCKTTRVVALTANAGSESKALYESEGFDGYLVKPVTGDELERELARLLPADIVTYTGSDDEVLQETISWMNTNQQKKPLIITTESVADLPEDIIKKYGIAVLPHIVTTEEGSFRDGIDIEHNGLLRYMEDVTRKVTTSAPDIHVIEEFFAKQLTVAHNVIHFSISDKMTGSGYFAAKEASVAFDNVSVINTDHLSSGQGLVVIEACRMAEEGLSPEEIISRIEAAKSKIHTSFIVDNLDFLARAEQVSYRIANITKSLMLRPVLELKNGKMTIGGMYIGARERAWKKYIDSILKNEKNIDKRILFVTYVGLTKKEMDWIGEQIHERAKFKKIYFQTASPVIAVNCGAGTFGLLVRDEDGKNGW
ncbi:MAG: DegV family EDD domain-containing protein [Lachnospiraceae bacterium]|nr:DegV family EDD domain-containing protein [Lachnospiraceae bacterium]